MQEAREVLICEARTGSRKYCHLCRSPLPPVPSACFLALSQQQLVSCFARNISFFIFSLQTPAACNLVGLSEKGKGKADVGNWKGLLPHVGESDD